VVLGISGDFSWTSATVDTVTSGSLIASTIHTQGKTDWYATLTGRAGYAMNNWLLYGKGGVAWVHEVYGGYSIVAGTTVPVGDVSDTRTGWTVGGGVEWGFWEKWSAFVEYAYLDFGTKSYNFTGATFTNTNDIKTNVSVVKAGINYRF
jgi:outer membrane immunogenic protein